MSVNIQPAAEARKETAHNEEVDKAIESVVRDIEKAKEEGKHRTVFCPGGYWLEAEVKDAFKRAGYWFEPVGYIGGVRQLDEYICW